MVSKIRFLKGLFSLLIITSIVFINTSVARADDTPQAPEVSETTMPTEDTEDPPVVDTPSPEATTPVTEEETTATAEITPDVEAINETSPPDLFEQIPDDVEVVVLDENGEAISLSSQSALDIILDTDPMWCPAGVLPGGVGCTTNFSSINNLLTDMRNNTGNYTQDGIIYFTASTGGALSLTTAGASLGTGDFNTLKGFNLTLQGGWNGSTASPTFSGQTSFGSNTLTIGTSSNPWVGNITVKDFSFSNVTSGNAITIYTTNGDITLNNVDVTQQRGDANTAYLDSQSGDITIQNNSTFDGNDSGGSTNRNRGFHAETDNGNIDISNTIFSDTRNCANILIICVDALANYDGATLSAQNVTLTNAIAQNNDGNGITISANSVTLNSVTANDNDLSGIQIANANSIWLNNVVATNNGSLLILGSGVNINGTGATVAYVTGGVFSNNQPYGIYMDGLPVPDGSIVYLSPATCSGNILPLLDPDNCDNLVDSTPPTLTLPANITSEATGPSGVTVAYTVSANDNVDGSVPVNCSPASGSTFAIGTTTVNCSASDSNSNTANGGFTVTVTDTTKPTLSLPANIVTEATGPSGASVTFSASASDLVDGSISVSCSYSSGNTFPIGTTTVNCSATDAHSNTISSSFSITVQDTTPPTISSHADIDFVADAVKGGIVVFSAPTTTDIVDGMGVANCVLASGSFFSVGVNTVTCTATDSHGNSASPVTFLVNVEYFPDTPIPRPGLIIPITGGELIGLDCLTIANAFGVKVTFYNLCDHQAIITDMSADSLPGQLPDGVTFTQGLNVAVLLDGTLVDELPLGTGVELDFPIPADAQDQFAVLLWDGQNNKWVDVTQSIQDAELNAKLSTEASNELYRISPTDATQALYRILTTEKTGTFVIVKK